MCDLILKRPHLRLNMCIAIATQYLLMYMLTVYSFIYIYTAFKFCLTYTRKLEFRRLCELLRYHLGIVIKYPNQNYAIDLAQADSLQVGDLVNLNSDDQYI